MPERRTYSRRAVLGLTSIPITAAVSTFLPESASHTEMDLSKFKKYTVAHNAALNPSLLDETLQSGVHFVEVDLTVVNGVLVVAHSPEEYYRLPDSVKTKQNPKEIIKKISNSGKRIMWDLKDDIKSLNQLGNTLNDLMQLSNSMASSNTHLLLDELQAQGFEGKILYSIESELAKSAFLEAMHGVNLAERNAGVSIRHSLLHDNTPTQLKDMNATIAAWNPESAIDIANAAIAGAHIITSGKLDLLARLGKPS